jgi:hypothetical protein
MRHTKKYMVEDYERLYDHASLLDDYLFDTQSGRKPDGVETYRNSKTGNSVRMQLWRASSASGGYVVIMQTLPTISYLDEAARQYAGNHSEHTLGLRICLGRLTMLRNRLSEPTDVEFENARYC